ncbi:MAG: hypothetical protein KGV57_02190 [Fusobacterium sp.]|nr:hypothetical protein [Fusobacterium sp.]
MLKKLFKREKELFKELNGICEEISFKNRFGKYKNIFLSLETLILFTYGLFFSFVLSLKLGNYFFIVIPIMALLLIGTFYKKLVEKFESNNFPLFFNFLAIIFLKLSIGFFTYDLVTLFYSYKF